MTSYRSLALPVLVVVLISTSCSRNSEPSGKSTAAVLTANAELKSPPARPLERHMLSVAGQNTLNEYILPDVRNRMDEEPAGESDSGYDPSALNPSAAIEQPASESEEEPKTEDVQQSSGGEDDGAYSTSTDRNKLLWAKRSFGSAVKRSPESNGVIVLYADENVYDVSRLMDLIQTGRNRIAEGSEIGAERIQVVFGGYRGTPQVELWVVPQGSSPEFRVEDRTKANEPEN